MRTLEDLIKIFIDKPKYRKFLLEVYPQVLEKTEIKLYDVYSHRLMKKVLNQMGFKVKRISFSKKVIYISPK